MQKSELNQVGFDKAIARLAKRQRQSMKSSGCSIKERTIIDHPVFINFKAPPTMIGLDTNLSRALIRYF